MPVMLPLQPQPAASTLPSGPDVAKVDSAAAGYSDSRVPTWPVVVAAPAVDSCLSPPVNVVATPLSVDMPPGSQPPSSITPAFTSFSAALPPESSSAFDAFSALAESPNGVSRGGRRHRTEGRNRTWHEEDSLEKLSSETNSAASSDRLHHATRQETHRQDPQALPAGSPGSSSAFAAFGALAESPNGVSRGGRRHRTEGRNRTWHEEDGLDKFGTETNGAANSERPHHTTRQETHRQDPQARDR